MRLKILVTAGDGRSSRRHAARSCSLRNEAKSPHLGGYGNWGWNGGQGPGGVPAASAGRGQASGAVVIGVRRLALLLGAAEVFAGAEPGAVGGFETAEDLVEGV